MVKKQMKNSTKRNSMGIGTASSVLLMSIANAYGIPITLEMAGSITGVLLMVVSEVIND